jgi:hypothetical protein
LDELIKVIISKDFLKLMKFTPDTLLQIYMDGSFTEEAQAEFNKLIRKDPIFAEQVSKAVAERMGEVPESQLDEIESRLDSKAPVLWNQYKPSPYVRLLKRSVVFAVFLFAACGLYFGYMMHSGKIFRWASLSGEAAPVQDQEIPTSTAPFSGIDLSSPNVSPVASSDQVAAQGMIPASKDKGSKNNSEVKPLSSSESFGRTQKVSPLAMPSANQALGSGALNRAPALSSNPAGNPNSMDHVTVPTGSAAANTAQPSVSTQTPGLPPIGQVPPPASGMGGPSEENDTLRVSIETPRTQNVIVTVLDSNGQKVRDLYEGTWNQGVHVVSWDGKDDLGNLVVPGNYTVVVNADGKTMSDSVTVQPNMNR